MDWDRRRALLDWKSEIEDSETKGRINEAVEIYRNELKMDNRTILTKIMEKFKMSEQTAKRYVSPSDEVEE